MKQNLSLGEFATAFLNLYIQTIILWWSNIGFTCRGGSAHRTKGSPCQGSCQNSLSGNSDWGVVTVVRIRISSEINTSRYRTTPQSPLGASSPDKGSRLLPCSNSSICLFSCIIRNSIFISKKENFYLHLHRFMLICIWWRLGILWNLSGKMTGFSPVSLFSLSKSTILWF